jgi:hypothetical protein
MLTTVLLIVEYVIIYQQYEQYSDDGERMMAIHDDHLHDDADGAFPVVIEDNDTEVSELNDDEVIEQQIQSIRVQQSAGQPAKQTTTVVRKSSASMTRPKRPASQIRPLVAKMTINGLDAIVMFDTGSTSDAVSPKFARVANMKIHSLDVLMGIQLGCKGSKSLYLAHQGQYDTVVSSEPIILMW